MSSLFQVPRSMNENELRPIFSEYGQLYELLVLRDKASGNHKGFVIIQQSCFSINYHVYMNVSK